MQSGQAKPQHSYPRYSRHEDLQEVESFCSPRQYVSWFLAAHIDIVDSLLNATKIPLQHKFHVRYKISSKGSIAFMANQNLVDDALHRVSELLPAPSAERQNNSRGWFATRCASPNNHNGVEKQKSLFAAAKRCIMWLAMRQNGLPPSQRDHYTLSGGQSQISPATHTGSAGAGQEVLREGPIAQLGPRQGRRQTSQALCRTPEQTPSHATPCHQSRPKAKRSYQDCCQLSTQKQLRTH
ncbi:hypothetical protein UY3_11607 [Chelonia mydas]|uniref:Uncharacterized protein n=1 Tax=Chelonia mydas TaxID=8469 RepID=M7B0A6_CHEMY|nr:hypothetical protein UY3_11607 [Chelonia mydas]